MIWRSIITTAASRAAVRQEASIHEYERPDCIAAGELGNRTQPVFRPAAGGGFRRLCRHDRLRARKQAPRGGTADVYPRFAGFDHGHAAGSERRARGRVAGLRRDGDRHCHHQQQLDSLQLQKPDQGADNLGGALGLRRDRPDHRRGAVYGLRHRLCGADVLSGAVPDV